IRRQADAVVQVLMRKESHMKTRHWLMAPAALVIGTSLASAQAAKTTADGIYTEEQATRGSATYQKECAACHQTDLSGEGFAPALIGDNFSQRWKGGNVGDLFKIVKGTMPADRPNTLEAPQYADIIAFVLKTNGYPAGSQPLSD